MKLLASLALTASFLAAQSSTVTLTVNTYSGDGPANLVSNAVPFSAGILTDPRNVSVLDGSAEIQLATKVLATWPKDNSIRSLLIQFLAPAAKVYTLQIGRTRTTADAVFTPVTWDLPARIVTLPAQYLSDSQLFGDQLPLGQPGYTAWDAKQISAYQAIPAPGTAVCVSDDEFYDTITTSYELYARTGSLQYLVSARRWALHHRRDQINLSGPLAGYSKCPDYDRTRYTYVQGLTTDFLMFGDDQAKQAAGLTVNNFYLKISDSVFYIAPNTRGFWTEREPAFALIGMLAYYEATNDAGLLAEIKRRVGLLHQMQVDNGGRAWVHNLYDHDPTEGCPVTAWGSSPWMSGLLLEAIVQYHRITGDPVARESILMAVDDLKARDVATGAYAGVSFIYLGCPPNRVDGTPDLDNLISHAYGYAYQLTGSQAYLTFGLTIFNTSVNNGYAGEPKQYNQAFRSSGHFVAYALKFVTPTAPANVSAAAVSTSQINVSWSASTGVAGYKVSRNGTLIGTTTALSYSDTGLTASTTYSYTVAAFDAAGRVSSPSSPGTATTLAADTTPPTVAITAPAGNATVSSSITVSATAKDNLAVADVQFQLDGVNLGPNLTTAPYSISWDTATSSNGSHTLTAIARDTSHNSTTSTPIVITVNNTVTAQGPIGYWNFDENSGKVAHDTSGSQNNGKVSGATWTPGKVNSALSFNGVRNSVITPRIAIGTTFSVSTWVKPAGSVQGAYSRIVETQYNGGLYLGTNASGTRYKFIVNTGSGATGSCGFGFGCAEGGAITAGWHLITGTFDGATARLYVDAVMVASETFTAPPNTNYPVYIGQYYGGGYGWNGAIDEVRLYNRALAAAEVAKIASGQ